MPVTFQWMSSVRFSRSFSSHLFGLVSFDNMLIFGHRYSPKSLASLDPLTPPAAGLAGVENRSVPPSRSRSLSGEGRREAAREDAADADHMGVADPERIDPSGVPPPSLPSRIPVADRAHMSCRPTAVSLKITAAHPPTRAQRHNAIGVQQEREFTWVLLALRGVLRSSAPPPPPE